MPSKVRMVLRFAGAVQVWLVVPVIFTILPVDLDTNLLGSTVRALALASSVACRDACMKK